MTSNWHILSLDSDSRQRGQIHEYLGRHGFQISTAYTARDLWRKLDELRVDLLLIGPNAHGATDLDLLQRLRQSTDAPVIVSDASDDESDRIIALELGADDYLRRPFNPRELLARIRGFQRRSHSLSREKLNARTYHFAGWTYVSGQNQVATPSGDSIRLTTSEARLLSAFVESPQRALSRERLHRLSADASLDTQDRSIDMMIWRLRRKLKAPLIRTERGCGYLFVPRVDVSTEPSDPAPIADDFMLGRLG